MRDEWRTRATAGALYLAALLPRLALAWTKPFGDEAHHYYVARHFGDGPFNVQTMGGPPDNHWLFWWRPLFSLLLSPGAQFGFTGFRLGYVLLVALLAPATWWWLRGRGVRNGASVAAGAAVALHPFLVVWGVRAFPDELMATAFVLGLAAWERGRRLAGAALLLAATWVKEVALVGVAVVLAQELLAGVRRDGGDLSVRVGWRHALLALVLALSYVPHLYAEHIGGRAPGWSRGGEPWDVVDGAFTTVWLVPIVAAGLLWAPSRRPALLALTYLAFFAGYTLVLHGRAEQWYYVLPTVLAFATVAAVADAVALHPLKDLRKLGRPLVAVLVAILAAQVLLPAATPGKSEALHPGVPVRELSYAETVRAERARDRDLWTAIGQLTPEDRQAVLLVDVAWFFAIWPMSEEAGTVATAYTLGSVPDQVWAGAIEQVANATLLHRELTPLSLAIGDVYGDCITDATREYAILRGQDCPGRLEQLKAAYEAHKARQEAA